MKYPSCCFVYHSYCMCGKVFLIYVTMWDIYSSLLLLQLLPTFRNRHRRHTRSFNDDDNKDNIDGDNAIM